ncbi:hypothetical protein Bca52824_061375 [Brassica carinata]|uniref:UBX domain-containing protein n=1 Tax=Brassica carinata TaxID=52824 RepID=A0A8X7UGF5_BRACI|nr:hypothetical protein Bca52824_061375 [Brassica carinata]
MHFSHPQTITVLWQLRKKVTIFSEKKDKSLKTRKLREAEEAARRAKLTKAVIRVRFPDNHTLEATFHPSEKLQSLADLLKRALAHTHKFLSSCTRTTPPKKQIKDFSQDFYYSWSYSLLGKRSTKRLNSSSELIFIKPCWSFAAISSPYLNEEMKDVEAIIKEAEPVEPSSEPVTTVPVDQNPRRRRRPQSLSGLKCD